MVYSKPEYVCINDPQDIGNNILEKQNMSKDRNDKIMSSSQNTY